MAAEAAMGAPRAAEEEEEEAGGQPEAACGTGVAAGASSDLGDDAAIADDASSIEGTSASASSTAGSGCRGKRTRSSKSEASRAWRRRFAEILRSTTQDLAAFEAANAVEAAACGLVAAPRSPPAAFAEAQEPTAEDLTSPPSAPSSSRRAPAPPSPEVSSAGAWVPASDLGDAFTATDEAEEAALQALLRDRAILECNLCDYDTALRAALEEVQRIRETGMLALSAEVAHVMQQSELRIEDEAQAQAVLHQENAALAASNAELLRLINAELASEGDLEREAQIEALAIENGMLWSMVRHAESAQKLASSGISASLRSLPSLAPRTRGSSSGSSPSRRSATRFPQSPCFDPEVGGALANPLKASEPEPVALPAAHGAEEWDDEEKYEWATRAKDPSPPKPPVSSPPRAEGDAGERRPASPAELQAASATSGPDGTRSCERDAADSGGQDAVVDSHADDAGATSAGAAPPSPAAAAAAVRAAAGEDNPEALQRLVRSLPSWSGLLARPSGADGEEPTPPSPPRLAGAAGSPAASDAPSQAQAASPPMRPAAGAPRMAMAKAPPAAALSLLAREAEGERVAAVRPASPVPLPTGESAHKSA